MGNVISCVRSEELESSSPACDGQCEKAGTAPLCEPIIKKQDTVAEDEYQLGVAALGEPLKVSACGPPLPPCEEERMETVQALGLKGYSIEAPPDPEIENILRLVCGIFQVPNALVALFDERRIFVREATGLFKRGDFPWRNSFCGWTLNTPHESLMVIPNATKDARFCNNPMVTQEGGVKCYVGAPLVASNGHRIGTLCFADTTPREIDNNQATIMCNFAEMVVRAVERDIALQLRTKDNANLTHAYKNLKRAIDALDSCVMLLDVSKQGWNIMYTNPAWDKLTGCPRASMQGHALSEVLEQASGALPTLAHMELVADGKELIIENVRVKAKWAAGLAGVEWPGDSTPSSASNSTVNLAKRTSAGSVNDRGTSARSLRSSSSARRLLLKLRPAAGGALDGDTIGLCMPAWLANRTSNDTTSSAYYFATIQCQEAAATAYAHSLMSKSTCRTSPMTGLQLGKLLGSGSYGSVFAGFWYGTPVAVKVIERDMRSLEQSGIQMEALLGVELRHPHIVSTLTWAMQTPGEPGIGPGGIIEDSAAESAPLAPDTPSSVRPSTVNLPPSPASPALTAAAPAPVQPATPPHFRELEPIKSGPNCIESAGAVSRHSVAFPVIQVAPGDTSAWSAYDEHGGSLGLSQPSSIQEPLPAGCRTGHSLGQGGRRETWIVLEFCDRGSLQDAIDRGCFRDRPGSMDGQPLMGAIVATACEVASALLYLHSHGIVHGDLSAWNVLLTSSGAAATSGGRGFVAKVADFGLSRALDVQSCIQTRTYGTITHQPPETLVEGLVSRETDTYSLGVLLWQMYTGSRPWAGMSHAQIIMAVASKASRLHLPDEAPDDFAHLAYSCLSYDAASRPSLADACQMLNIMKTKYCGK